ncbi:MAG TPA: hypothetical protein VFZ65_15340 [Planctomycetota bacterium]|nr:hypothetical protein [Planctomycetota bacterium]
MARGAFQPGFRLSPADALVLAIAAAATVVSWSMQPRLAPSIAFVTANFFLFCNVFRVARRLELLWAGLFVALSATTLLDAVPAWLPFVASSVATFAIVLFAMRRPGYHGLGWQRVNPGLRTRWEQHADADDGRPGPQ